MRQLIADWVQAQTGSELLASLIPGGALFYVLAMLAVMYVFLRRGAASGLDKYHILGLGLYAMIGGLAGARLFYLLQRPAYVLQNLSVIFDVSGGTASWGAYTGGILGLALYIVIYKIEGSRYLDVLASCLALGPAIGRWSCFMNGCCYGLPSKIPWTIQYPVNSYAYADHLYSSSIGDDALFSLSVHPFPVYAAVAALILFWLMTVIWKRNRLARPGFTFISYWILYGLVRFVVEFFRGEGYRYTIGFNFQQIFYITIATAALLALIVKFNPIRFYKIRMGK